MIGKKEMTLITTGKKLGKKFKSNFSRFMEHDFYVRITLVDEHGLFMKEVTVIANADNWMDYITEADFGDLKVDKIEISASGR